MISVKANQNFALVGRLDRGEVILKQYKYYASACNVLIRRLEAKKVPHKYSKLYIQRNADNKIVYETL